MSLMASTTLPKRFSERPGAILAASGGVLEGLGRVWEAKMAPRYGLEGVLGSSSGSPGRVLRPSGGWLGGGLAVKVAKLAPRGLWEAVLRGSRGDLEGLERRLGGKDGSKTTSSRECSRNPSSRRPETR